jgi:hypothetical protein
VHHGLCLRLTAIRIIVPDHRRVRKLDVVERRHNHGIYNVRVSQPCAIPLLANTRGGFELYRLRRIETRKISQGRVDHELLVKRANRQIFQATAGWIDRPPQLAGRRERAAPGHLLRLLPRPRQTSVGNHPQPKPHRRQHLIGLYRVQRGAQSRHHNIPFGLSRWTPARRFDVGPEEAQIRRPVLPPTPSVRGALTSPHSPLSLK